MNILKKLDFLTNQKTIIASGIFIISNVLGKYGYSIPVEGLTDNVMELISVLGVLYGLVIKILKYFIKK